MLNPLLMRGLPAAHLYLGIAAGADPALTTQGSRSSFFTIVVSLLGFGLIVMAPVLLSPAARAARRAGKTVSPVDAALTCTAALLWAIVGFLLFDSLK